jgi:hypothetical protein
MRIRRKPLGEDDSGNGAIACVKCHRLKDSRKVSTIKSTFTKLHSIMHFLIIIALFAALGLTISDRPYALKVECMNNKEDCKKIDLKNKLDVSVFYSTISVRHGHISVAVFCEVLNPTDTARFIDRDKFSIVSSSGIQLTRIPFRIARGFKIESMPDTHEVRAGIQEDYVFVFRSSEKYTKRQIKERLKMDTYYFLHQTNRSDTLFILSADDKRLRK